MSGVTNPWPSFFVFPGGSARSQIGVVSRSSLIRGCIVSIYIVIRMAVPESKSLARIFQFLFLFLILIYFVYLFISYFRASRTV